MLSQPADDSLDFRVASESGDMASVTDLIVGQNRPLDCLHHSLTVAALNGQLAVARYILDRGAARS